MKIEEIDGITYYIYNRKLFRKWYHENSIRVDREVQLNELGI